MSAILRYFALASMLLIVFSASSYSQSTSDDLRAEIDGLISDAYRSAAVKFPCKLKTRGKAKMLRWENVDKCLNNANDRIDWDKLSEKLQAIREKNRFPMINVNSAIEFSLSEHAIPFEKAFRVREIEALLPLTNSMLKYLPSDSLMNLPVYDKSGERVGYFSGVYSYERSGGLAMANSFRMSLFQYTDLSGEIQTPSDKLLMDSYGVPWKGALKQAGFRLPSDKLIPER
jgi:hypothetical protein